MPTLDWTLPKTVLNHHNEVPFRLLRVSEDLSVGDPDLGFYVVDLSDQTNPVICGHHDDIAPRSFAVDQSSVFMTGNGMRVYDVSGALSTGSESSPAVPAAHSISAFPNPFNSSTTITFGLGKPAPTRLSIYDLQGRLVADLLDRQGRLWYGAGEHKVVWEADGMPGGIYLIRLESGSDVQTTKMVLLK